jgi:hypothetical protein
MVQLSATRCSCIAILWVSLVSFAAITLCVASQRVIPKVSLYFVTDSVRKLLNAPSYIATLPPLPPLPLPARGRGTQCIPPHHHSHIFSSRSGQFPPWNNKTLLIREDSVKVYLKVRSCVDMDRIEVVQGKIHWRAILNRVMKFLRFYKKRELFHQLRTFHLLRNIRIPWSQVNYYVC